MESLHIKLDSPIDTRKELLKTAIETTQLLQFHENFKKIRAEKIKTIKNLRTISKQIINLSNNLQNELPEVKITRYKESKTIKEGDKPFRPRPLKPKPLKKFQKQPISSIQKELKDIEAKLNSL